ncbi:ATP-binding protein [Chlorobium phaeovibrioides]|uniref:ATP-binding protein n=1 Tax=Chlorobium phaeovibrioides TaxID=1094 RepID=A0A432AVH9_CHLPH|nr:ATP-binding protein [Chlorobium phaeovibrioides]KAA6232874.1 ATP-binding protein [Chlorobium phaeovibrioides]RTY38928.1 ATP-binding protein [Chlorobium phaeovibrioides]
MNFIRRPASASPLLDIVSRGEGLYTEFKLKVHSPPKVAKPIAAFANTLGGTMLVGVDDDGSIKGIHSEKEALEIIHEAVRHHIDPIPDISAYVEIFRKRLVLVIIVPESTSKPHVHCKEPIEAGCGTEGSIRKVYIREGSHSRALADGADKIDWKE